ncbi:MAG: nucleotidyltransferase substrate binding protein [Nitrospirae bacterium]|nr:nucleotidyltransferase substrate binding protein [Nitrospirota bacterium]
MRPIDYAIDRLQKAYAQLKDAVERAVDDLDRDGVIQRFEFTFEAFWKCVKILVEHEGFTCQGPRSCIKEGARRGYLSDGQTLLDMLEDKNRTLHVYSEAAAQEIFERIKEVYIGLLGDNIKRFKDYIGLNSD